MGHHEDRAAAEQAAAVLATRYTAVFDLLSRCARALEAGNWSYLQQKTGELAGNAGGLAVAADKVALLTPLARLIRAWSWPKSSGRASISTRYGRSTSNISSRPARSDPAAPMPVPSAHARGAVTFTATAHARKSGARTSLRAMKPSMRA